MNANEMKALRMLGALTAGSFDSWRLAGSHNAARRAEVMSAFNGCKTPQSKSGVTAMREAFHALAFNYDAPGFATAECLYSREECFSAWASKVLRLADADRFSQVPA